MAVLLWRALRLRCPTCGKAQIFRGWFSTNETCTACGRRFQRDPGYFLGSIYFNYGVTGLLVIVVYFTMYYRDVLTNEQRLGVLILFVVLFPMWFFRYARALWTTLDEYFDPWPNVEEARAEAIKERRGANEA